MNSEIWVAASQNTPAQKAVTGMPGQVHQTLDFAGANRRITSRRASATPIPNSNKYAGNCFRSNGLRLDVGGYLPGLEEAGNASIPAIGKPSITAFETAAGVLGVAIETALMIGDDVEADVQAAQKAGMIGVLVRTGKHRESVAREASPRPDHIIDSIAELPDLIASL